MKKRIQLAIGLVSAFAFSNSYAYMINSNADSALTGASVIDFEAATIGNYAAITLDDVTFSTVNAGEKLYISNAYGGNYNTTGISIQNTYNSNAFKTLRFDFAAATSAFGFNWGAADISWTLAAYASDNSLIESIAVPATYSSNAGQFYGIANNNISYAVLTAAGSGDYVFIDNFHYIDGGNSQEVPVPASIALFGLAALGLAFRKKS